MANEKTPALSPAPKRPMIDRDDLTHALAERERRDAQDPPPSLLTTMGAIRLLGDLVLDRAQRGWTDPMLVALLRELGVEISAETLRVYRGRLKLERYGTAATERKTSRTSPTTAAIPIAGPADDRRPEPADSLRDTPDTRGVKPTLTGETPEPSPPTRPTTFDDRV